MHIPEIFGFRLQSFQCHLCFLAAGDIFGLSDRLLGIHIQGKGIGGQGARRPIKIDAQVVHIVILVAAVIGVGIVIEIKIVQQRRIGVHKHVVIFQIKIQEFDVLASTLGIRLIISADQVNRTFGRTVSIIVIPLYVDGRAVIMTV